MADDPSKHDSFEALLDQVAKALGAALDDLHQPPGLPDQLAGHPGLAQLFNKLIQLRRSILAIANGNLAIQITTKGFVSGAVKTLQAHLNHLTWQTQMIAKGDYSQRVDFMGDFSEAFNSMVAELASTVKALRESEKNYRKLAHTDPLTGLFNRRHFYQRAELEVKRSLRHQRPLALAMMDIDKFKRVNDEYGHDVGDRVLQMVAVVMEESLRDIDVTARFGGEEFVVLLPETDPAAALQATDRLRVALSQQEMLAGMQKFCITASLGVSRLEFYPDEQDDPRRALEKMIKAADTALYAAKQAGRNRVAQAW